MKSEPGTYILVLESGKKKQIQIGKWGKLALDPGYYLYVGSAFGPGGVRSRVSRHCREEKSKRWHIDFLRVYTHLNVVWYAHGAERLEHRWANALAGLEQTLAVKGFGCSDCRCLSHLFFVAHKADLDACASVLAGRIQQWTCDKQGN